MKIHVDRRRWRLFLASCILVALVLVCFAIFQGIAGTLESIHAADRFRGDNEMRFAQLACFMPEDSERPRRTSASSIRPLTKSSSTPPWRRRRAPASTPTPTAGASISASLRRPRLGHRQGHRRGRKLLPVPPPAPAVRQLYPENDFMQDRVVLDETLAWQLFGGFDVAGLSVTIDGKPFYVAGVVRGRATSPQKRPIWTAPVCSSPTAP